MAKSLVCCQEDVRVEKASFGKGKGRMFFPSVNIISCVYNLQNGPVSKKKSAVFFFLTIQILNSVWW